MSRKKARRSKPRNLPKMGEKTKSNRRLYSLLIGVCTFVGFAASIIVFLPRPNVSAPTVPFDIEDSFSVSFDISNNGFVPLHNCTIYFGVGQVAGKNKRLDPLFIPSFESRFVMPAWKNQNLGMDDRLTAVLSDLLKNVASADIAIIVSYNPWIIPIRREKIFRFVTFKHGDGRQFWRSWPVGETLPIPKQKTN